MSWFILHVILCHTIYGLRSRFHKSILNCLFPQESPNRLVLHILLVLDMVASNCSQMLVDMAGRQQQRLLEQLESLHLAVRRWMKSRSPRRPWSWQHHRSKTSKSSLLFHILRGSSLDSYPIRTSHILLPTVSSLHSTQFTSDVSSLVVPTATESRTLAPSNSDQFR